MFSWCADFLREHCKKWPLKIRKAVCQNELYVTVCIYQGTCVLLQHNHDYVCIYQGTCVLLQHNHDYVFIYQGTCVLLQPNHDYVLVITKTTTLIKGLTLTSSK